MCRDLTGMLRKEFQGHGVFALAAQWNCPLMWSHHGDQHRGLCIEFSTDDQRPREIGEVCYGGSRVITLSELAAWKLQSSIVAQRAIFETIFYSKASDWAYEREYRVISEGPRDKEAPFRISAVYFGLMCDPAAVQATMKLVHESDGVLFHSMCEGSDGFDLGSYALSLQEAL